MQRRVLSVRGFDSVQHASKNAAELGKLTTRFNEIVVWSRHGYLPHAHLLAQHGSDAIVGDGSAKRKYKRRLPAACCWRLLHKGRCRRFLGPLPRIARL